MDIVGVKNPYGLVQKAGRKRRTNRKTKRTANRKTKRTANRRHLK
jgi:hypothetical protein